MITTKRYIDALLKKLQTIFYTVGLILNGNEF